LAWSKYSLPDDGAFRAVRRGIFVAETLREALDQLTAAYAIARIEFIAEPHGARAL
jgi:hypothetical protein